MRNLHLTLDWNYIGQKKILQNFVAFSEYINFNKVPLFFFIWPTSDPRNLKKKYCWCFAGYESKKLCFWNFLTFRSGSAGKVQAYQNSKASLHSTRYMCSYLKRPCMTVWPFLKRTHTLDLHKCPLRSTDQAYPSCFYFRIWWILMEQRWF